MGPAHHAATSESGARSAGPLLSGNLETVFTSLLGPGEGLGRRGKGQNQGYNLHTQCKQKEKDQINTFFI